MIMPRLVTERVEQALRRQAAVALIGPRQVGKTTLALEIGRAHDALYLDLEDRDDRNRPISETLEAIGVRGLAKELRGLP
jgi:predicted AAA+ superfamily ATPase